MGTPKPSLSTEEPSVEKAGTYQERPSTVKVRKKLTTTGREVGAESLYNQDP